MLAQLKKYPVVLLFFAFLLVFFIGGLLAPDHDVSELENRPLTQRPVFNASFLQGGGALGAKYDAFATAASGWTLQYNEYAKDQLPLRDGWISMHSALELAQGKLENGGVWYAAEGYQIAKNTALSSAQQLGLSTNTQAVASLAARYPGAVSAMIVPSPANTLSNLLPWSPPQIDENALLDDIFEGLDAAGAKTIDLRPVFAAGRDTQLYYYTDHHWTTGGGAWLAYQAFCAAEGLPAIQPDPALFTAVPDFYGTNYAKTKKPFTAPDTLDYYAFPNALTVYAIQADGSIAAQPGPLMDTEKLAAYDKYAAFLRGNNGYSVLEGDGEGSVLVIKDSYGNSFVPYLLQNYEKVGIIDLRAWFEVDETIREGGYDSILVLYSFDNFSQDQYAMRMFAEGT